MAYDKEQFDAMVADLNGQDIPGVHKVAKPRRTVSKTLGAALGAVIVAGVGVLIVSGLAWAVAAIWGAILD